VSTITELDDWRIILKWTLIMNKRVWTGFFWLEIRTSGELL
jgi:hypothetical protein